SMTARRGATSASPPAPRSFGARPWRCYRQMDVNAVLFILASCTGTGLAPLSGPVAIALVAQQQPDTRYVRELGRWGNAQDLGKLQSGEGKPRWVVLLILGHPSRVERRAKGDEVWDYPWVAACRVWFKNGVCTGTFYTAGY